jgi:RNA polymerase sigma factor (sigma-70 family)
MSMKRSTVLAEVLSRRSEHPYFLAEATTIEDLRRDSEAVLEVVAAFQEGRPGAADLLIKLYDPFIMWASRKFVLWYERDLEDFAQEGRIAVLEAAARWDSSYGTKSATGYVFKYVRGFLKRYATVSEPCVRLPVHLFTSNPVKVTSNSVSARYVREILPVLTRQTACHLACEWASPQSPDLPAIKGRGVAVPEDEDGSTLPFDAFNEEEQSALDVLADLDVRTSILEIAAMLKSSLDPRKFDVLWRRFGYSGPEETLNEIGDSYGLCRERVRQLESQALATCREKAIAMRCNPSTWNGFEAWVVRLVETMRDTS